MLNSQFAIRSASGFILSSASFFVHSALTTIDFDKDARGAPLSVPGLLSET